ncbi:MAG: GGDEF domain-containing protein, partial [Oceanospirillum sp.]|nr:GGDEF domain-containing protein [Oceanospirillum sp.]
TIRYDAKHDWLITLAGILITVLVLGAVIAWYVRLNRQLEDEVTLRKQAQSAAMTLARTDQLTGIMNRHGAEPLINQEMARCRRYQTPVSMMILDIDHFKRINDSMGHKAGDDALRWLCTTLSDAMRETDHLVRWGGEEFLVLLPETRLEAAGELAGRYRQLIGDLSAGAVVPFTVSIGVSQLNAADSFSQWYQRTDLALYQAKNGGRNRVQVSDHQHETGPAEPSL